MPKTTSDRIESIGCHWWWWRWYINTMPKTTSPNRPTHAPSSLSSVLFSFTSFPNETPFSHNKYDEIDDTWAMIHPSSHFNRDTYKQCRRFVVHCTWAWEWWPMHLMYYQCLSTTKTAAEFYDHTGTLMLAYDCWMTVHTSFYRRLRTTSLMNMTVMISMMIHDWDKTTILMIDSED